MTRSSSLLIVAVFAGAMGCASAPAGTTAATGPSRNRDIITQVELENSSSTNLHEAIERLRPTMMRNRGRSNDQSAVSNFPRVYLDGHSYGDLNSLRSISVPTVAEVRYMSAADATTRYGIGHSAGLIHVISKR